MENSTTPPLSPQGAQAMKPATKRTLILGGIIAAIALIVIVILLFMRSATQELTVSFSEKLPYQYAAPQLNVDPAHTFEFAAAIDPTEENSPHKDAIAVYSDSSFTKEVPIQKYYFSGTLKISAGPALTAIGAAQNKANVELSGYEKWGPFGEYYVVQRQDLQSGKTLDKPIVTKFTVKSRTLASPTLKYSVDKQGAAVFSWNKVDGAERYAVVKLEYTKDTDGKPELAADLVGETRETSWNSVQQDSYLQQALNDRTRLPSSQNGAFKNFTRPAEEAGKSEGAKATEYTVIAIRGAETSLARTTRGDTLEAQLPVNVAGKEREKQSIPADTQIGTFDAIPARLPITMADGTTALRLVVPSAEGADTTQVVVNTTGTPTRQTVLRVPYTVYGTVIRGFFYITNYDNATYPSEIARIAARNNTEQAKTGNVSTQAEPNATSRQTSSAAISRDVQQTSYKVNATNSFTKYIATNMIAGKERIDVSRYRNSPVNLWDAYQEALSQNPYILAVKDVQLEQATGTLQVQYYTTGEQRKAEQAAIASEVDRVTKSIIQPGMSDKDKAVAINTYLTNSAEYNYDALTALRRTITTIPEEFVRSWTPAGVLLDKKGVCASYAYAFKALADAAQLPAVYVTGLANGELHAWNKVRIDGAWRVIDATWNDARGRENMYLLVTDEAIRGDHQQDDEFIINSLIGEFATR